MQPLFFLFNNFKKYVIIFLSFLGFPNILPNHEDEIMEVNQEVLPTASASIDNSYISQPLSVPQDEMSISANYEEETFENTYNKCFLSRINKKKPLQEKNS